MPVLVRCPHCSESFHVPDEFVGRKGKCPACHQPFVARPADAPAPAASAGRNLPKARPLKEAAPAIAVEAPAVPEPSPTVVAPPPGSFPAINVQAPAPTVGGFAPSAPVSPSSPTARGRQPEFPWLMVGLGAGGGLLLLTLIVGGSVALLSPSRNRVAENDVAAPAAVRPRPARKPGVVRPRQPVAAQNDEALGKIGGEREAARRVASKLEEVRRLLVKIQFSSGNGTALGTGFILNEKGWVATNHHVIEQANDSAIARFANGVEIPIEGILADAPRLDLAIIKLRIPPKVETRLDISYEGEPELGSTVYAYGHPHGQEFTLSEGIVSTVVRTRNLDEGSRAFLASEMNPDDEHQWIAHKAEIYGGNSGGPLIDKETLRIIGVNTWGKHDVRVGFASHIRYVRQLLKQVDGTVTPLPEASEVGPPGGENPLVAGVNKAMMERVYQRADDLDFKPSTGEEQELIAELARQVAAAKLIHANPAVAPGLSDDQRVDLVMASQEAIGKLQAREWSDEQRDVLNTAAAERLGRQNSGVLGIAVIKQDLGNAFVAELQGSGKTVLIPRMHEEGEVGDRFLLLGLALGRTASVNGSAQHPMILSPVHIPLP